MTQNLEPPSAAGGSTPLPTPPSDLTLPPDREQRRKLLLGGLGTGTLIVTLASRPALADTACTWSAFYSVHPSHTVSSHCGDSQGCWRNKNYDKWPSLYYHSEPITNALNMGASINGTAVFNTNATLSDLIQGAGTVTVNWMSAPPPPSPGGGGPGGKFVVGGGGGAPTPPGGGDGGTPQSTSLWTATQQANIVSALLNQATYGSLYFNGITQNRGKSNVVDLINDFLNGATAGVPSVLQYVQSPTDTTASDISALMGQLDNILTPANQQGEICA